MPDSCLANGWRWAIEDRAGDRVGVSVRDVLPARGFSPAWGTATDLDPAYEFTGGGIEIGVAQVTSLHHRPELLILDAVSRAVDLERSASVCRRRTAASGGLLATSHAWRGLSAWPACRPA